MYITRSAHVKQREIEKKAHIASPNYTSCPFWWLSGGASYRRRVEHFPLKHPLNVGKSQKRA